jgi:hypothetical protein
MHGPERVVEFETLYGAERSVMSVLPCATKRRHQVSASESWSSFRRDSSTSRRSRAAWISAAMARRRSTGTDGYASLSVCAAAKVSA